MPTCSTTNASSVCEYMEQLVCNEARMMMDFEIKVVASDFEDGLYNKLHNLIKRWIASYNNNQKHHAAEITEHEDNQYIIIYFGQLGCIHEMELPMDTDLESESDHDDDTDSEDE